MNKNVEHDGKSYPKGSEIKESDNGFKALTSVGHADEVESSEPEKEVEAPIEQPVQEEHVDWGPPKKKGKK